MRAFLAALMVFVLAASVFAYRLDDEKFFADEASCLAQTYYFRLARRGEWHHPDWVHPGAYDHLPIGKWAQGLSLEVAGQGDKIPTSVAAWEWWMAGHYDPPTDAAVLPALRHGMLLAAAAGVALFFLLGRELAGALAGPSIGALVGSIAALLLIASPLYATHARRAMADDLTQALVIAGMLAFVHGLRPGSAWSASGRAWCAMVASGASFALAAETKLNGASGAVAAGALGVAGMAAALFLGAPRASGAVAWRWGGRLLVLLTAFIFVFFAVNPFFWAKPAILEVGHQEVRVGTRVYSLAASDELRQVAKQGMLGRLMVLWHHRSSGLEDAMKQFPNDALPTVGSRAAAVALEGLGRWSAAGRLPLPPTGRSIIALAGVVLGLIVSARNGWAEARWGHVPVAWLPLAWFSTETAMLLGNLTLNWDRYYLGIVVSGSLTFAYGVGAAVSGLWRRMVIAPPGPATS